MSPATAGRARKRARTEGAADVGARARAAAAAADALGAPAAALALDAVLAAAGPARGARDAAAAALRTLRAALRGVGGGAREVVRAEGGRGGGAARPAATAEFALAPPEAVDVVGGFMLGLGGPRVVVDVAVRMPRDMFQSKDFRNHRYHGKRLAYLQRVAQALRDRHAADFADVAVGRDCLAGDPDKPLLTLSPVAAPAVTIRVLPAIAADVFDAAKLAPDRGNVRPPGTSSLDAPPTPAYNASVLIDTVLVRHLATLHAHAAAAPAFADAARMLRAWAVRRRLPDSGFVAAALLAHTLASGAAPARAAKEHLFRAAVGRVRAGAMASLAVDGVAVSARWDSGLLARWRAEAAAALAALDAPGAAEDAWAGVVPSLFATARGSANRPVPLATLFDAFVTFAAAGGGPGGGGGSGGGRGGDGAEGDPLPSNEAMTRLLRTALVDTRRVEAVEALGRGVFGLVLRPPGAEQDAYRKVDVRHDSADAAAFTSFWGPKAEVRLFKDGRVVESLVWSGGLGTMQEMVRYACARHFGDRVSPTVVLAQVEEAAGLLGVDHGSPRAIALFNELSTMLRKVDGLPLSISAVLAVSPHLRRCAVQPVRPQANSKYVQALDVLAVFEQSGAWPDDVLAMASAKAGFYLALKAGLAELGIASKPTVSFIDILLGGLVFRLRVRVDKEKLIAGMDAETRQRLAWETESRALLHDAMRNVQSAIFGDTARLVKRWLASHVLLCEFGERAEELVELLVARVMSVHHGRPPRSVLSGFCQCMHLLAEFPWEAAPLVVPLSNAAPDEAGGRGGDAQGAERQAREDLFQGALDRYSAVGHGAERGPMFVATTFDQDGSWFGTRALAPERVVLKRAAAAAAAALSFIGDRVLAAGKASSTASWGALFRTPSSSFHHALLLDRAWVPRASKPLSRGQYFTAQPVARLDAAVVGLDPVERLAVTLRHALGRHAMFLYDTYGGSRIFVVWRPAADAPVAFSLQSLPFMTPEGGSKRLVPNKAEMLACIRRLGGTMIRSLE